MPPFRRTGPFPRTDIGGRRIRHPLALALGLVALVDVGSALLSLFWV